MGEETVWVCYYCGHSLGSGGRDGARLGKCPVCGREQVGSGIAVVSEEQKRLYNNLKRTMKRRYTDRE